MTVRQSGALEANVGPAIVHCSAGIGRSGTFCLVDSSLVIVSYCGIIKILGCLPVFVCEVYVPWNQQKKIHTCEPLWVQLWVRTGLEQKKDTCICVILIKLIVHVPYMYLLKWTFMYILILSLWKWFTGICVLEKKF